MRDITTEEVRRKLVEYVRQHPETTIRELASRLGVAYSTLTKVLRDAGYRRRPYQKLADLDLTSLEARR